MRSLILLSILGLVAADVTPTQQGQCLVNSGEAVSDAMDATLFIWAANKRCGKVGMALKCEVDVTSAIKAVNGMINVILKSVDQCDALNLSNKKCVFTAGQLTKHISGLAASIGDVAQKCPKPKVAPAAMGPIAAPVMCTIDMKNTAKQLFKAIAGIRKASSACKDDANQRECAASDLDVLSSIAGMGAYLAGAIGQCKRTTAITGAAAAAKATTRTELCAQAAQQLVHDTAEVAEAGVRLSQDCRPTVDIIEEAPRLFEQDGLVATTGSANLILGAFLPITAIVGFVGGRFYANNRALTQQTREFMSDHE